MVASAGGGVDRRFIERESAAQFLSRDDAFVSELRFAAAVKAHRCAQHGNDQQRCAASRLRAWINGVATFDYTEAEPNIAQDGHIAIQIHGGGMALVQVKDVRIE